MRQLTTTLLLWLVLLLHAFVTAAVDTSNQQERTMHEVLTTHMSTKTVYPAPTHTQQIEMQEREQTLAEELTCRPVQLNFVIRHGTRHPTIKDIERIAKTHEKLRSSLSSSVTGSAVNGGNEQGNDTSSWIQRWTNPYKAEEAGWLARVGIEELIAIGARLRSRFGAHFAQHSDSERFVFESTWKVRTQQSASAFAFGFFLGKHEPVHMQVAAIGADHALRFFDNCPAYDRAIDENATATIHHAQYRSSAQMQQNLMAFRKYAEDGSNQQQLTQKDLEAAYAGCAFDVATRGVFDEWCSLFDEAMLLSLDYFHDLKHFYKKSHGNALAFEIAAPLLQDVFRSMKARIDGKSAVEGHFRFAHAETILPLASLLNLSHFDLHGSDREGHFLAETPLEVAKTRKFQASALAPFAANIGFALYECDGDDEDQKGTTTGEKSYKVMTLLNERQVSFRECGDQPLCPFSQLEKIFQRWIHEFDFHEQCQ